jgi:hypothetical protein
VITYTLTRTGQRLRLREQCRGGRPDSRGHDLPPGSLTLEGATLTDAADADAERFTGSGIAVGLGFGRRRDDTHDHLPGRDRLRGTRHVKILLALLALLMPAAALAANGVSLVSKVFVERVETTPEGRSVTTRAEPDVVISRRSAGVRAELPQRRCGAGHGSGPDQSRA